MYKIFTITIALVMLFVMETRAQNPHLVKDLAPGTAKSFTDPPSGIHTIMNDLAIFTVQTENGRFQLMRSDGTEAGTFALLPSYSTDTLTYSGFVQQNGLCWFLVFQNGVGTKLYATDGTAAGTVVRLSDPNTLSSLKAFKSDLLFRKRTPNFEPEYLERFNTTDYSVFTVKLFDWFVGMLDYTVAAGDTIYAIGGDDEGRNLYKGDGSQLNMQKIVQINSGSEFNQNIYMYSMGNKVFFFWQKSDTNEPYKLWVTDGTAAGTKGLKEFETPFFENPVADKALVEFGGKFYFRAKSPTDGKGKELYVSDGTAAGTKLVKDMNSGQADSDPSHFTILDNKLWISALDNLYNPSLWLLSGNTAAEQLNTYSVVGGDLARFKDSLVMSVYSSTLGSEILIGKGAANNTRVLTDFSTPGNSEFYAYGFAPGANVLYFVGGQDATTGRELWVYRPAPVSAVHTATEAAIELAISPNPVEDQLLVSAPEARQIQVSDIAGKIIFSAEMQQNCRVNTAGWAAGLYSVSVWSEKGRSTQLFVKR